MKLTDLFSFSTSEIFLDCLLASTVSHEKVAVRWKIFSPLVTSAFFPSDFKISSLTLLFYCLIMINLDAVFIGFNPVSVC